MTLSQWLLVIMIFLILSDLIYTYNMINKMREHNKNLLKLIEELQSARQSFNTSTNPESST